MIRSVRFKQDDAAIGRRRIEDDGQSCAGLVRVGGTDACPARTTAFGALDGIGDEDRICGHDIRSVTKPGAQVKRAPVRLGRRLWLRRGVETRLTRIAHFPVATHAPPSE